MLTIMEKFVKNKAHVYYSHLKQSVLKLLYKSRGRRLDFQAELRLVGWTFRLSLGSQAKLSDWA